jgi:hypothetical protein
MVGVVDGGRSWTFSSGTSRGSAVDVFTLMVGALGPSAVAPPGSPVGAPGPPAPAPLGARRRRFHVDGGCSWTFSSGTSWGPTVDVFTLMVGAPGPSALTERGAKKLTPSAGSQPLPRWAWGPLSAP